MKIRDLKPILPITACFAYESLLFAYRREGLLKYVDERGKLPDLILICLLCRFYQADFLMQPSNFRPGNMVCVILTDSC